MPDPTISGLSQRPSDSDETTISPDVVLFGFGEAGEVATSTTGNDPAMGVFPAQLRPCQTPELGAATADSMPGRPST